MDAALDRLLAATRAGAPPPPPAPTHRDAYDADAERARNASKAVLNRLATLSAQHPQQPHQQAAALPSSEALSHHRHADGNAERTPDEARAVALAGPGATDDAGSSAAGTARLTAPISAVPAGIAFIVHKVKVSICARGLSGFVQLQRTFRALARARGTVGMVDFKHALRDLRIDLTEAEMRMLFDHFCDVKGGAVDAAAFIRGVRPALSDRRARLVLQVFAKLDVDGDGVVSAEEVASVYDPAQHPEVLAGRATANAVLADFLESFDVGAEVDGHVTQAEFVEFYTSVGAAVASDEYFELLMRNVWHVGGAGANGHAAGEGYGGAAGAPAVRRVLVTRADGSQYVEDVVDAAPAAGPPRRVPASLKERFGTQGAHTQVRDTHTRTHILIRHTWLSPSVLPSSHPLVLPDIFCLRLAHGDGT